MSLYSCSPLDQPPVVLFLTPPSSQLYPIPEAWSPPLRGRVEELTDLTPETEKCMDVVKSGFPCMATGGIGMPLSLSLLPCGGIKICVPAFIISFACFVAGKMVKDCVDEDLEEPQHFPPVAVNLMVVNRL